MTTEDAREELRAALRECERGRPGAAMYHVEQARATINHVAAAEWDGRCDAHDPAPPEVEP